MFTLEIGGRPVAVTDAEEAQARELFESEEFKDDLRTLESDEGPIWDGRAMLTVSAATEEERAEFEEVEDDDGEAGDEEDGSLIVFLVPIDTDEDEDASS